MGVQFYDDLSADVSGLWRGSRARDVRVREYRLDSGYVLSPHAHSLDGVVVMVEGRFTAEIDRLPFHVETGQALILPAGAVHRESVGSSGATCLLIELV